MSEAVPLLPDPPASPQERPRSRSSRIWIMGVLVLIAAGVALFVMDQRGPAMLPPPTTVPGEPDFSMEGVVVHQYRDDGTLEYLLQSSSVQHFERRAETRLEEPHLALFDPVQAPWRMSAQHGTLRRPPTGAPEETVSLRSDVTLEQTPPDGRYVRLTTSALDVYPGRQYAETEQDVIIDSLVGRTTAIGLEGDLKLGLLTFHSTGGHRVHTVLQPEEFK